MIKFTYTAQRSLISGHSVGEVYEWEVAATELDFRTVIDKTVTQSMAGQIWTTARYAKRELDLEFVPLQAGAAINAALEFFHSIQYGEEFLIDIADGFGNKRALFTGKTIKQKRRVKRGDSGVTDMFEFGFTVTLL